MDGTLDSVINSLNELAVFVCTKLSAASIGEKQIQMHFSSKPQFFYRIKTYRSQFFKPKKIEGHSTSQQLE